MLRAVVLVTAVGCVPTDPPYVDDPVAYIEDAAYRRRVLRSDLVTTDNAYAQERLEHVGRDWDDLPTWDPPTIPVTTAMATGDLQFDPAAATTLTPADLPATPQEWIDLGRRAFLEYPLRPDDTALALLHTEGGPEAVGFLVADGAYVGLRAVEVDGEVQIAGTCAQCHVSFDPTGALSAVRSNRALDVGRARLLGLFGDGAPELDSTDYADLADLGPGRADVLADSVFNPYAFPDLGGIADVPFLHHTGNWFHRGTATLALRADTLFTTASHRRTRIPRVLAWAVAEYLRSLPPPPPAEPDHPLRDPGAAVFDAAGCPACHPAPAYTADHLIPLADVGTDPAAGESGVRGTGHYRAPSLRGVGGAGPYLHHGGVDSLDDLFDPSRAEPGHPFGQHLDESDRQALIGFLRSL